MVAQFSQQDSPLPKHPGIRKFMQPVTGGHDLVSMEGQTWKIWRKTFNPAFSANHMMTLVPSMMEEVMVFRDILREHAEKQAMFSLDEATINATMDVIGKVALDARLNSQRAYNDLTAALRDQIRWCQFGTEPNPFDRFNPLRPIYQWYNTRRMDRYITNELQKRYTNKNNMSGNKTIIDLALKGYLAELPPGEPVQRIDSTFKEIAMSQLKLFIFGGHDTAATTICYSYLLLSRNPSMLRKLREEHDNVLGTDIERAPDFLASQPHPLNQLPYTLATIKETLRLFPVVTSPRAGHSGYELTDSEGRGYPTEHCLVWSNHHGLHNNPLYWPKVEEFLPDRWLVPENHPLHPFKNAWRPFEFGPRNCIGQELALTELKLVLAITAREFDVRPAYEELDTSRGGRKGVKTINGERAYQIQLGSTRPSDGFPARAYFASR